MSRSKANAEAAFAQFLEERRHSLGGSDAHHLLGLPPYGCERQLFFDKAGYEPDFPFEGNHHTRRGTLLEDIAASEYARATGRRVQRARFTRKSDQPHVGLHMDRKQWGATGESLRGPGLLEIKIPSSRSYAQLKNDGPAPSYEVQAQWGLWVTGLQWATVWIWNPDLMEGKAFHRERDEAIIGNFGLLADHFWTRVLQQREAMKEPGVDVDLLEVPFGQLEDGHRACETCKFRTRCKGIGAAPLILTEEEKLEVRGRQFVEDESIRSDAIRYADVKKKIKELNELKEAMEKAYKPRLLQLDPLGKQGLAAGDVKFYVQVTTKNLKAQAPRVQQQVSLKVIVPKTEESDGEA